MNGEPAVLCPSSRCGPGALLLGIVQADGTVALAGERMEVDSTFVESARQGRSPEKRFRFARPCLKGGCKQWTGTRCGVIDFVVARVSAELVGVELRPCAIRSQCRWFHQRGAEACAVCPLVITDFCEVVDGEEESAQVGGCPKQVSRTVLSGSSH